MNSSNLSRKITVLKNLKGFLDQAPSISEKIKILDVRANLKKAFKNFPDCLSFFSLLSKKEEYVLKSAIAIGQMHLFHVSEKVQNLEGKFKQLVKELLEIENFYEDLGGIIGYQIFVYAHLKENLSKKKKKHEPILLHPPSGIDIRQCSDEVKKAIFLGIKNLPLMGEIYPLGGAGDRLDLRDDQTKNELPASKLVFLGKTLLEGLIRDLVAREYLYYKLFGKQILTPIAIMTSMEKENHRHILEICENARWFGRPKESIKLFCQPSVPTFTKDGDWCLKDPLSLLLKPGGHGAVWKLAKREGIFQWFKQQGKTKALIRQINNPIAGIDYGILAFLGYGHKEKKLFGFSSCPRKVKTCEGINVIKEKNGEHGKIFSLSNIEYCNFKIHGIKDASLIREEGFSIFPSNTNILFADFSCVETLTAINPYPGMLVNFKEHSYFLPEKGEVKGEIARLESTMQNIADALEEKNYQREGVLDGTLRLKSFITFNHRHKTISAIKKSSVYHKKKAHFDPKIFLETPDDCFMNYLYNAHELLTNECNFKLPPFKIDYFKPPFIFTYHPALGPFYSIIKQKIRGGKMERGSEMRLEIADVDIEDLHLSGSLLVQADSPLGQINDKGLLEFSVKHAAKCRLKHVTVKNKGIDFSKENRFWKSNVFRKESFLIRLAPGAEFFAENVTIKGKMEISVPENTRYILKEEFGKLNIIEEKIDPKNPLWQYGFDSQSYDIILAK